MFCKFVQQVRVGEKVFKVGIHDVEDAIVDHPDFLHFVKCGWISEATPAQVAAQPEPQSALAQKLLEKVNARREELEKKIAEEAKKPQPAEGVHEQVQEKELTPAQKAAATRKANEAKKAAEEAKKSEESK